MFKNTGGIKVVIDKNELSTKDKILHKTLDIIKKEGIDSITIRRIAKEADINISLINYYFGSKDNLINESIKIIMLDIEKLLNTLDRKEIDPKKRLKLFLLKYVEVIGENASIIRTGIANYDKLFQSQIEIVTMVKQMGLEKIKTLIKEITKLEDEQKLYHITLQLIGAMFFPIMILPVFETNGTIKYNGKDDINGYIDTLINNMFREY